jgi:hypothetical protein
LGISIAAGSALAQNLGNPGIVPPDSNEFGNTYGEWSARWWQWLLSIPEAKNPNLDDTGADCAEGQTGQVWFLAGTFGDHAYMRSCTIPGGKELLLTPLVWIFGELGPGPVSDCPSGPNECDPNHLRALAAANSDNPQLLEVTIDSTRLQNVDQYRVTSPVFSAFFPEDAIFGIPHGTHGPLVSDGYFVLVNPLSPGRHTIHLKGVNSLSAGGSVIDVIYHLNVRK